MSKQLSIRIFWGFLIFLIAASAIFFVLPYLSFKPSESRIDLNPKIDWHFPVLLMHAITGGLALLLGPFQFIKSLRTRHPHIHRIVGRVYVISVTVGGLFAVFSTVISTANAATRLGFGILAVLWLYTIYRAYSSIRKKQILVHQVWMIRNYALTLAAVTLRLWLGIGLALLNLSFEQTYTIAAWLSWIAPLLVAEWFIVQGLLQARKEKAFSYSKAETAELEPELA